MKTFTFILFVLMVNFISAQKPQSLHHLHFKNGLEAVELNHYTHQNHKSDQLVQDIPFIHELPDEHSSEAMLKHKSAGVGLDSIYHYDLYGELKQIDRYYYTAEGYTESVEKFYRHSYINQPFDVAVNVDKYQYDNAGRMISRISKQYDFDNHLPGEDYFTVIDTEFEFDAVGNQTFIPIDQLTGITINY